MFGGLARVYYPQFVRDSTISGTILFLISSDNISFVPLWKFTVPYNLLLISLLNIAYTLKTLSLLEVQSAQYKDLGI